MDRNSFEATSPGELVEIGAGDCGFVPLPLPPTWAFPKHLWELLTEAHGQLSRLDGKASFLPDPDLLLRPLQNREALRSSSLEGTYATPQELLLFELDPQKPTTEGGAAEAWREVYNYTRALRIEQDSFGLHLVRQLHSILLEKVRGQSQSPGAFRTKQVYIGAGKRFIPPPATSLTDCLGQFESFMQTPSGDHHPLVRCYLAHYQFETIHPFMDGNGRVGRLLLALMIKAWCKLEKPWLYMSAFFEKHKDQYIDKLFNVSAKNDWESWIQFCLLGTKTQAEDAIARCDALVRLQKEIIEGLSGNVRLVRLVEMLFRSPVIRVVDVKKRLDITYPTARADIDRLVDAGVLKELSDQSPKAFYAPRIFDIAFREE